MIKLFYDEKCAESIKAKYDQAFDRKIKETTDSKRVIHKTIADVSRVIFSLILFVLFIFKIKMEVENNSSDEEINFWFIFLILAFSSFLIFVFLAFSNVYKRKTMIHDYECKVNEFEYPIIVDFYLRTKDKNIVKLSVERIEQLNDKLALCATVENEDGLIEHLFFELQNSIHSTKASLTEVDLKKATVIFPYKKDKANFEVYDNK